LGYINLRLHYYHMNPSDVYTMDELN